MASKSIAKRPNGRWRARYRDDGGKEHARHFDRKVDAQRWLDEITADVLTGVYVDPRAGKVTFREYAERWQKSRVHRRNTAAAVDSALRVHAIPRFGARPMNSITTIEVQEWVQQLSSSLAPATVRVTFQHFRAVFLAAEQDRVVGRTPCKGVVLPAVEKPKVDPLSVETVAAIAAEMPGHWRAVVTLMAGTGMRPGEAAGVTLDRVDFLRRQVRVDRQLLLTRPHTFGPPKTASSNRTIPLPQLVLEALSAHIAEFGTGEHGMLFTAENGTLLNRDYVTRAFGRAVVKAGAPSATRMHDLRHHYASLLIRHGCSVKVVQSRLGHKSAMETLDTYGHLWPDSDDQTRDAVDLAWSSGPGAEAI